LKSIQAAMQNKKEDKEVISNETLMERIRQIKLDDQSNLQQMQLIEKSKKMLNLQKRNQL
jgi:hypothetical protein